MRRLLFIALLFSTLFTACSEKKNDQIIEAPSNIPNLGLIKDQILFYKDSGKWEKDIEEVASVAKNYLKDQLASGGKLAVVFDVDETALFKWTEIKQADFAELPALYDAWFLAESAVAIVPILDLYKFAKENGCALFFISGRDQRFQTATENNLKKVGYDTWNGVFLRPGIDNSTSLVPFKSEIRRKITEQGFRIVVNIGDQYSDLEGGFAEKCYKIPNPMYYIK